MHQPILDALRRGAHDEALAAAREAVAGHPDDAQAHRWLAVALAQAGKPQDALESIDSAIALAPEDADLHLVRGSLLLAMRETDKAGAALSQATTLDPNQLGAYFLQAQLALARGDADEAERQARLAAILAPEHPQLDVIHGMAAVHRGDTKGAIQLLTTASERGEDPQLLYALGHAYLQEGHIAFAEQAFAKMLEMTPDSAGLRGLIAALRLQQRRPGEALEVLQPVLDAAEPAFAAQRMAGIIELAASRPQQALRWLRAAFSMRPTDARVISAAAQAWQGAERQEEARDALDAALAAHPRERALWQARIRFAEGPRRTGTARPLAAGATRRSRSAGAAGFGTRHRRREGKGTRADPAPDRSRAGPAGTGTATGGARVARGSGSGESSACRLWSPDTPHPSARSCCTRGWSRRTIGWGRPGSAPPSGSPSGGPCTTTPCPCRSRFPLRPDGRKRARTRDAMPRPCCGARRVQAWSSSPRRARPATCRCCSTEWAGTHRTTHSSPR
jgi:Flp pilus assembly protein TadD